MRSKGAVYNEFDPAAAAWLRELIAEGHIAAGDVDERSIKDVSASDYRGYAQVHCFAGIGIWSHALRRAGWDDERPVGTASCPCQGFSVAGKGLGFADPRHLWPDYLRLVDEAREQGQPWTATLFGEQVASAGAWLDLVQSDLEARYYAFAASDLPAAGFGGAHIRQRFYWLADRDHPERWADLAAGHVGDWPQAGRIEGYGKPGAGLPVSRVAHHQGRRFREEHADISGLAAGDRAQGLSTGLDPGGPTGDMGHHHHHQGLEGWTVEPVGGGDQFAVRAAGLAGGVDWLLCTDGGIRPVESGTFPLADEDSGRVGRLRGYGNALDAEVATQFVGAFMEAAELRDLIT